MYVAGTEGAREMVGKVGASLRAQATEKLLGQAGCGHRTNHFVLPIALAFNVNPISLQREKKT